MDSHASTTKAAKKLQILPALAVLDNMNKSIAETTPALKFYKPHELYA